jgi:hypothetical protein
MASGLEKWPTRSNLKLLMRRKYRGWEFRKKKCIVPGYMCAIGFPVARRAKRRVVVGGEERMRQPRIKAQERLAETEI